jgi:hypothetical protein
MKKLCCTSGTLNKLSKKRKSATLIVLTANKHFTLGNENSPEQGSRAWISLKFAVDDISSEKNESKLVTDERKGILHTLISFQPQTK